MFIYERSAQSDSPGQVIFVSQMDTSAIAGVGTIHSGGDCRRYHIRENIHDLTGCTDPGSESDFMFSMPMAAL